MTKSFMLILGLGLCLFSSAQSFNFSDTSFQKGDVLRTYSIKWELAKADLRAESYSFIDSLYKFLILNDSLTIEVGNHVDERKSSKSSTCLSCKRSEFIVDYLVEQGIDHKRLLPAGYGKSMPIIREARNELEHRKNRRTEIIILSTDYK